MAEKEKKKKHKRISVRMYKVITLMVFIATLLGIVNSTVQAAAILLKEWINQGSTVAQAAAGAIDAESAWSLSETLSSDTAVQLYKNRTSDEAYTADLNAYLEAQGQEEFMTRISNIFTRIERTQSESELILLTCTQNACRYTGASSGHLSNVGLERELQLTELSGDSDNKAYIAGNTLSDGEPVLFTLVPLRPAETADRQLYIGVVRNMAPMLKEAGSYILNMLTYLLVVSLVCAFVGSLLTRQLFAVPIMKVKNAAEQFRETNTHEQSAEPVRAPVHTRDEIEDLSDSLYELESSVVETQNILREEYIAKGKMSAQLQIASGIQNGALPTDFPGTPQYELFALMHPAKEVGGDFYDFFLTPDRRHLVMVIGDVSDKGIPAALFMMAGKTSVRSIAMSEPDPSVILARVNNMILEQNPMSMFITIWIGILDLDTGELKTASAGHEYPFMALEGKPFEQIEDIHGLVIGELPDMKYTTCTYQLQKGDRIFVYTDGATDAENTKKEQIGMEKLLEIVNEEAVHETAKELSLAVKDRIYAFSEGMPQFDDITILSLNWFGTPEEVKTEDTAPASETAAA